MNLRKFVTQVHLSSIILINLFAVAFSYELEPENCDPLTYELIADLVTKEAREILEPRLRGPKRAKYDLYTRLNRQTPQVIVTDDEESLLESNFNSTWPIRITIHGWFGKRRICSNYAIKNAYLDRGDFNVIILDWSDYALDINYVRVVFEMYEVAKQLNDFTHFLHRETGIDYKNIYLIGHSLGCHVAGLAGKLLRPEKYGVIYSLDAAGPLVNVLGKNFHITKSDALYVESIQTDVGMFGFRSPIIGHASFLPNWGLGQPHCPNVTNVPDFTCDHFGSLYYFIESIRNPKAFGAVRCPDYACVVDQKCGCGRSRKCKADAFMGGEPAVPKEGIFYLSTRDVQPFGYGEICRIKKAIEPTIVRMKNQP